MSIRVSIFIREYVKFHNVLMLGATAVDTTRIFKNGNSQAVRIPSDLAYERTDIELEIERLGEQIRIRPVRRN